MLLGMIGSPCSGKTTIATKMFTNFKEVGTNCELVIEAARQYIAKIRFDNQSLPEDKINLTDQDQKNIALKQLEIEKIMKYSCGINTIIISDSSVINAGLYMSSEMYEGDAIQKFFHEIYDSYDLLFFCHPINLTNLPQDPNRVHDLNAIKLVQQRANNLLERLKKWNPNKIHELIGTLSAEDRCIEAASKTLNEHFKLLQRTK